MGVAQLQVIGSSVLQQAPQQLSVIHGLQQPLQQLPVVLRIAAISAAVDGGCGTLGVVQWAV